jgi:hypothetical protein
VLSTINAVLIDPLPAAVRMMALDRPAAPADVAGVPDRGAAVSGRRETAAADNALQHWQCRPHYPLRLAMLMKSAVVPGIDWNGPIFSE